MQPIMSAPPSSMVAAPCFCNDNGQLIQMGEKPSTFFSAPLMWEDVLLDKGASARAHSACCSYTLPQAVTSLNCN